MNANISESDRLIVKSILDAVLPCDCVVWIFGSRATGKTRRSSDLDLAIEAGRALTKAEEVALWDAFEASNLPYKVDVVDLYAINTAFKEIIEREKIKF